MTECDVNHEAVKRDELAWSAMQNVRRFVQDFGAGEGETMEMAHCPKCHSTLYRRVEEGS